MTGVLALSCGWAQARTPGAYDWMGALDKTARFLSTPAALNAGNCARVIGAFAESLSRLPSAAFAPRDADDSAVVVAGADRALRDFFHVRLLLKQRLDAMRAPPVACVDSVRRAMRIARFAEDYLAQWLRARGLAPPQSRRLFGGGPAQVSLNPGFADSEPRPGDVIMMRGPSFVSSLIARAGDEAGDFSHLALVGEDSTGKKWIIEGLIEKGVVTTPLDEYLQQTTEGRAALLRHRDARLARRAARAMYDEARAAIDRGAPIGYNFRLDGNDTTRLYCAQVVARAFALASGGALALPRFTSRLSRLARTPVYSALGITADRVFAPSDLQIDNRFDIVAEYRNADLARETRHANVAMARLVDWMAAGYSVRSDWFANFLAGVLLKFIRGGDISVENGAPGKAAVALLVSLDRVASSLITVLARLDESAERASGHGLTFAELARGAEEARIRECRARDAEGDFSRLFEAPPGACPPVTP